MSMKRILSIDGGGIRGIIPALILSEIERKTGRPIATQFDLLAGTSTGGIICLGLTKDNGQGKPQYSAQDMVELYENNGRRVFARSFWKGISSVGGAADERYDHKPLEDLLKEYLDDEPIGTALTKVMVTSYDIENRNPFFFKSWNTVTRAVPMRHAARATSAAPLFFEPARVQVQNRTLALIDGAVFANNPTMSAFAEARRIFPNEQEFLVVSIGTGELTRPITYNEAKDWGLVEWAFPILGVVFDGVSDATDYHMHQMLNLEGRRQFYRFQTRLDIASDDLDNVARANLIALRAEAMQILRIQRENLDEVCAMLEKSSTG
jgi:hypothetical protein